MKNTILFLLVVCVFGCDQSIDNGTEESVFSHRISLQGIPSSSFAQLVAMANRNTDRLDPLPDSLELSDQIKAEGGVIFVKYITLINGSSNYFGEFRIDFEDTSYVYLSTYDSIGSPLDNLCFISKRRVDGVWSEFFSEFNYLDSNTFVVEAIDSRQKVLHPSQAVVLESWTYSVEPDGGIKLVAND